MSKKLVKQWRDAATLIIAARSQQQNTFKILMLKRSAKSKVMPNSYVFPGGVVSNDDFSKDWVPYLKNSNNFPRKSVKRPYIYTSNDSHDLSPEIGFRICALRETFEESGVLLVRDEHGNQRTLADPDFNIGGQYGRLGNWRDKVNEDAKYFQQIFHHLNYTPDLYNMYEWSTWLTPTFLKTRFDTMFYMIFINEIPLDVKEDEGEMVDLVWISPQTYFAHNEPIQLAPPQFHEFCRFNSKKSYALDVCSLIDWSTWLSPTFRQHRFNTMFYIVFTDTILENHSSDNFETTHSEWFPSTKLLNLHFKNEINLQLPQIYEISRMNRYKTFNELEDFTIQREQHGLTTWYPYKYTTKDGYCITYPGDDLHDNVTDVNKPSGHLNLNINELPNINMNRAEVNEEKGTFLIRNNTEWCGHHPLGEVRNEVIIE